MGSWYSLILSTLRYLPFSSSDLWSFRSTCFSFKWRYHFNKAALHRWFSLSFIHETYSLWRSCIHLSAKWASISLLLIFVHTRYNMTLSQSISISLFIFLMWRNDRLIIMISVTVIISSISTRVDITGVNILFLTTLGYWEL